MTGGAYTLADCAAAPALFDAGTDVPLAPQRLQLAADADRRIEPASAALTIDQARP